MEIITSWDDGDKEDLRLLKLLEPYDEVIDKNIFFIPNNCSLTKQEIRQIGNKYSVGGHTVNHPQDIKLLNRKQKRQTIRVNKNWLEDIVGEEIDWFCYPRGRYDDETIEELIKAGYKHARTTKVLSHTKDKKRYEVETSVHAYPDRREYNNRKWTEVAKEEFDKAKEKDGVFHLWGHSWELSENKCWEEVEQVLEYIKQNVGGA